MTPDLAARLRAYREDAQRRLDAGPLGRRGTTNRALDAWQTSLVPVPRSGTGEPQAAGPVEG